MKRSLILALLLFCIAAPAVADDVLGTGHDTTALQSLAKTQSSKVAFVRYTLFTEFMGREVERELTTFGTMVDSSGVVLISGQSVAPTIRQMGQVLELDFDISDVTVTIGGKTYEAKIGLKELRRDRVMVRLGPEEGEDSIPAGRSFEAVATSTTKIEIGDPLLIVSTLGEKYDFAANIRPVNVCGITKVPSIFYNVGADTSGYGASPVFNMSGALVGVTGMRTELTATGKVRTLGQAGMNPLEKLAESLKKVPAWDDLGSEEDEEEEEEDGEMEEDGDVEGSGSGG